MRSIRLLTLASCICIAAIGQGRGGRNMVSVGGGGGFPIGGSDLSLFGDDILKERTGSGAFAAGYEFRIFRYLAPEVGVVTMSSKWTYYSHYPILGTPAEYSYSGHVTLVSFGARAVAPMYRDSVEFFAGGGGAYLNTGIQELNDTGASHMYWQIQGGFRVAIDRHRRRFWLGPTVRYSHCTSYGSSGLSSGSLPSWLSVTADLGYRF